MRTKWLKLGLWQKLPTLLFTLNFIVFLLFLEKKYLAMYLRKEFMNHILLMACTNYIPNTYCIVSLATLYFSLNIFCSNVRTDFFSFSCLRKKQTIQKKKTIYTAYVIYRFNYFKLSYMLKTIHFWVFLNGVVNSG